MTETETELNLILLKLCEDTLPKTTVAGDTRFTSLLKKLRHHLEAQKNEEGTKK